MKRDAKLRLILKVVICVVSALTGYHFVIDPQADEALTSPAVNTAPR